MRALIPLELLTILTTDPRLTASFLVGGCVRDALLGRPNHDFDIEVFGISYDELVSILAASGRTDLVGRSFGVVKLTTPSGATFDFTIPRRDSKVAPGHKGFAIAFDPAIDPREAAARRDFTINALMYDPRADRILDFFGGRSDLENRVLRHTSAAFGDDPLRVLRGMQFVSRFALQPAVETVQLARAIKSGYAELAVERVRDEWFKWASKSVLPSAGLKFLRETEWIEHFPEIAALVGTRQDPEWHPEGDVFVHTCHCLDALVRLPAWQEADADSRTVYSLAVLGHDFGKPPMTQETIRDGRTRIISPGHEEAGGALAASFLARINAPQHIRERVLPLVTNHLAHLNEITDRSVRRLAKRLEPETIESLTLVMTADHFGRPPKPCVVPPNIAALRAKAAELNVAASAPKPIFMGRHLIELGLRPGKQFGSLLANAFEAQLEGSFTDLSGAWRWLNQQPIDLPPDVRRLLQSKVN